MKHPEARTDPITEYVSEAFRAVVKAEALIYAGGGDRKDKDDVIAAHSALLRLRDRRVNA